LKIEKKILKDFILCNLESLDAVSFCIDDVKRKVPIWKKVDTSYFKLFLEKHPYLCISILMILGMVR
jgi:hypothetical protein